MVLINSFYCEPINNYILSIEEIINLGIIGRRSGRSGGERGEKGITEAARREKDKSWLVCAFKTFTPAKLSRNPEHVRR